ncbi:MAG: sigma-54-dependent Fis family transcriptional regulator, partial [Planctomycetes bacterium]|nr:sigma-54-dependent Fis family transcriptional regulator [Planctomycetota bacterium]
EKALEHKRLLERAEFLQREVEDEYGLGRIVGSSPSMQAVYALARKAIESDATILLLGESGTGKELFAKAIHYSGRRCRHRFVAINCGAIPKDLMESELFGHVKGAFSGATADKAGLFDEADGGSLFLDEISELNLDLQVKINRAIQEREIRSVGGTRDRSVDVRIIAATNADLLDLTRQGLFREDLYYRLNVFPIQIPPLRERREDIPLLVEHFLAKCNRREGKRIRGVTPAALDLLMSYDWPGNVRELENAVERALILADGPTIGPEFFAQHIGHKSLSDMPSPPLADLPYHEALGRITADGLREYFTGLLRRYRGNVTKAAAHAGIERESLHRLLRQYGIDPDEARK